MESKILSYIEKFVELNSNEKEIFVSSFTEVRVKKRQFIVQPEFIAKYRYYILTGAFRAYVLGDLGNESTITLAIDDWWITDYNSYIFQQPATMFVIALEDSVVLKLEYGKEQVLKAYSHKFETFFRIIAERGLAFHQRRLIASLTQTAEERYDNYVERYPQIVNRVPQYVLASYLGMTTEFLSRIRKKKQNKKS